MQERGGEGGLQRGGSGTWSLKKWLPSFLGSEERKSHSYCVYVDSKGTRGSSGRGSAERRLLGEELREAMLLVLLAHPPHCHFAFRRFQIPRVTSGQTIPQEVGNSCVVPACQKAQLGLTPSASL